MGRLADRLEHRRHPLYPRAKDLCGCAVDCWHDDGDESELHGLVEENMAALTAPELDLLVHMTLDECELHPEAEDLSEMVLDAIAVVSETIEDPDDSRYHTIFFALPLLLKAPVLAESLAALDEGQCEALRDLLVEFELLAEDAEVTFVPRLLSPLEADALAPGDIYALSRALANDEPDTAMEHLRVFRQRLKLSAEPDDDSAPAGGSSYGVLAGVVTSCEDVAFVMSRLVEVEHAHLHEEPELADPVEAHAELVSDLRAELDKLSESLADILDVREARIVDPASNWNSLSGAAHQHERSWLARNLLTELAQTHCAGDVKALTVGRPDVAHELLTFPVLRRADSAPVAVIHWREGRHEDGPESLHRFLVLLADLEVEPAFDHDDIHAGDQPLH